MEKIPLIKPFINDEVRKKVIEVLDSGYLTEGPVTREFETLFRNFIGCRHAIAVTSCTTGLETALRALNIGPGDEVIVPDYTYPATASVVPIVGATAVIVDSRKSDMLIDYDEIEKAITPRTKAIIPVSGFGNPLDCDRLDDIKKRSNIKIIEDSACAIGAEYKGRKVGTIADISVFSLHPRKFITTGEGGVITTENSAWADWMESYKHFGMGKVAEREQIVFERIGTNYKMSNIQAAVGVIQMHHIDELLAKRLELSERYISLLKNVPGVEIPATTAGGVHSRQSFCIYVPKRDEILKKMRAIGIEVQIGTYSLHMHPAFNNNPLVRIHGKMTGSCYAYEHCLALPLYNELSFESQDRVVETLRSFM